jgi:hypothetical protein
MLKNQYLESTTGLGVLQRGGVYVMKDYPYLGCRMRNLTVPSAISIHVANTSRHFVLTSYLRRVVKRFDIPGLGKRLTAIDTLNRELKAENLAYLWKSRSNHLG